MTQMSLLQNTRENSKHFKRVTVNVFNLPLPNILTGSTFYCVKKKCLLFSLIKFGITRKKLNEYNLTIYYVAMLNSFK